MTSAEDLATVVEGLTGPDREVDAKVGSVMHRDHGWHAADCLAHFTVSLDAAMTLVPEGWDWSASSFGSDGAYAEVWQHGWHDDTKISSFLATTPALALTAAALRAQGGQHE